MSPEPHPQVWKVDPNAPEDEAIVRAALVIGNGGVIIYPTETYYGLGGHPGHPTAVERIYRIKGRNFKKPLPMIASDVDSVRRVVAQWPEEAEKLALAFWPGPLTLILAVGDCSISTTGSSSDKLLSSMVHGGTGKIAARVSSHPVAQSLSSQVGGLLISTSANFSGEPPFADPERVPPALLGQVEGMLCAGRLAGRMPSTIVDVSCGHPRLVRNGCLSWDKIQAVLSR